MRADPVRLAIGIDLVEVDRVDRLVRSGFDLSDIFTDTELSQCVGRTRAQSLAARFAAKEALSKMLGCGLKGISDLREVETRVKNSGEPEVRLHGATARLAEQIGVGPAAVSLTHTGALAAAVVVSQYVEGEA